MEEKYNKIELLALIKNYNKKNADKIKNVDKLKKEDLLEICKKHALISCDDQCVVEIDLRNISKKDLMRDVELYFLQQNKRIPNEIIQLKKQDLIDFMEINCIKHYTSDMIEKEIKECEKQNMFKNIIVYNIMRYNNIDVTKINNTNMEEFITENQLDTDIRHLQQYSVLVYELYQTYEKFCASTNMKFTKDSIKSLPKIIEHLQEINL